MPVKLCTVPRCGLVAAYKGRCRTHARAYNRQSHPNKRVYNSTKWKRTRERQLFDHPLCQCGAIATDVDHVTPIEAGGDVWAWSNLQSLCQICHGRKTRDEQVAV